MFNPVAPYGYLLPNMYLFMADIANPDFFSSFMLFISALPVSMVPLSKESLAYCFLYSSYRLFDSSDRPGMWFVLHPLGIYLLEATRTLSTNSSYYSGMGSTSSISLVSFVD